MEGTGKRCQQTGIRNAAMVAYLDTVAKAFWNEDFWLPPNVTWALLDQRTRARGGLVLHILVAAYMFIGLAIVCEDYFVPSLTRVSDG